MLTRIHITFTKVPAMSTLTSIHRDATCATSHRPSLLGRLRNMLSLRAQRHALAQLGAEPERSVMVGDSGNDVNAGLAAGCRVICVTYGYNRGADVYSLGADRVIEAFGAVWDCVEPEGNLAGTA